MTCGYEFGECASAYSAPHECALDRGHRWSLHTCGCGEHLPRRLGFRIYFDFNDWWIGYYRGEAHHYICPLPSLVFRFNRTPLHARNAEPDGD